MLQIKKTTEEFMYYLRTAIKNVLCIAFAFFLLLLYAPVQAKIHHDQNINKDTVWNATQVHIIDAEIKVSEGASLSLDKGTVVKFKPNAHLNIQGALKVNGTSENKIYFTSIKDDSIGGDTNGDGNATTPKPGDWGQIRFHSNSNGTLNHVVLRHGGHRKIYDHYSRRIPVLLIESCYIQIKNCLIKDNFGGIEVTKPDNHNHDGTENNLLNDIVLKNNTIKNNQDGIFLTSCMNSTVSKNNLQNNTANGGITLKKCANATVYNNIVKKNSGTSLSFESTSGNAYDNVLVENQIGIKLNSSAVDIYGNRIEKNSAYGLKVGLNSLKSNIKNSNTINENGHQNNIAISGSTLKSKINWDVLDFGTNLEKVVTGDIRIADNGSLTLNPGTIVKWIRPSYNYPSLQVKGRLEVQGTDENPVSQLSGLKVQSILQLTN